MEVRVYRSVSGDCLFITGNDGRTILVDGGLPEAYEDHWMRSLNQVHAGDTIDLVIVSHIDEDHIGGILRMLDHKVDWAVYEYQRSLPPHLRTTSVNAPDLPEPHDIGAIWHNAFFDEVRTDVFSNHGVDVIEVLARSAAVLAGASSDQDILDSASYHQFLGQSAGHAIEVSRRIGPDQLGIDLNPEYGGDYVVRTDTVPDPRIGGITATILGPTRADLEVLLDDWNDWVVARTATGWLGRILDRHDRDERHLAASSPRAVLESANASALALNNQRVTPPNLASIVVLLQEGNQRVLLTGDADDPSIIAGLEAKGLMDANGRIHVDVFKVPHHGAHNSYSDDLARRVTADHYVFCGDGDHGNPEEDVVQGYLVALFGGVDGHGPAAQPGRDVHFWFNCSSAVAPHEFTDLWLDLEDILGQWEADFPEFHAHFLTSGQSFVVD